MHKILDKQNDGAWLWGIAYLIARGISASIGFGILKVSPLLGLFFLFCGPVLIVGAIIESRRNVILTASIA